jgi:hypothetical protein
LKLSLLLLLLLLLLPPGAVEILNSYKQAGTEREEREPTVVEDPEVPRLRPWECQRGV